MTSSTTSSRGPMLGMGPKGTRTGVQILWTHTGNLVKWPGRFADDAARGTHGERSPHSHHVRRVVLPSGKTIDVVYFEEQAVRERRPRRPPPRLATCTSAGLLVRASSTRSTGRRRAPGTGRSRCAAPTASGSGPASSTRTRSSTSTRSLDEAPTRWSPTSSASCTVNMQDEIARFVDALDNGHIVPDDF